jgi:hypothetical protein
MKVPSIFLAPLGLALALAGCGSFEAHLPDPKAIAGGSSSFELFARSLDEGEAAWAARNTVPDAERAATIRKAIAAYEKAWANKPDEPFPLARLSIAHYYLANYFVTDEDEKEKLHTRGRDYGQAALLLNPAIKQAVDGGASIETAVAAHAKLGDVPAMYWMVVNWARIAEKKSIAVRAGTAPKLKTIMETVYRLAPRYYWGGVHRFFGGYFTKAPGQSDPGPKSKQEFELAIKEGPEDLENRVLMAEYYAVFVQDRALYEKILKEVLATPPDYGPELLRLDNAEAKKRARRMLAEADEKF